jgi:predicted nucleic acid-binding protein
MIRVVLDPNVMVSGILSEKCVPGRILRAWLEYWFHLVTPRAILEELRRVLGYPKISRPTAGLTRRSRNLSKTLRALRWWRQES